MGMVWYQTSVILPAVTPPRWVFGPIWGAIYALTTLVAIVWYESAPRNTLFTITAGLFIANATLNVLWSALFFGLQWIMLSFFDCALLTLVTCALFCALFLQVGRWALLILPYIVWTSLATYLTWSIALLNH